MANLALDDTYQDVYQIETTDFVIGGPTGTANAQAKQLGSRDNFLKDELDNAKARLDAAEDQINDPGTGLVATNERLDTVSDKVDAGVFTGLTDQGGPGSTDIILDSTRAGKVIVPQSTDLNFQITTNIADFPGDIVEIKIFAAVQTCTIQVINSADVTYTGTMVGGDTIELAIGDLASIWGSGSTWYVHVTSNK